jgi:hypothetical protein
MNGPAKITLDNTIYTVDPATSDGSYLVAYSCSACQWSDCTPLHGEAIDAMEAAIEEVTAHHAEFHGNSGTVMPQLGEPPCRAQDQRAPS